MIWEKFLKKYSINRFFGKNKATYLHILKWKKPPNQILPIYTLSSPILLFEDYRKNDSFSEILFYPGLMLNYLTERIFETETGQSLMLGLFLLSLFFSVLYTQGITKLTVRNLQISQATRFSQIGHPFYVSKFLSKNPLLP
jgi:hypothetical protein